MKGSNPQVKNLILDMDGVLWHGDTPVPGLAAFFETIDKFGLRFVLATNNATKTSVQYIEKLSRFGIDIRASQIITASEATATFLRNRYPMSKNAYVIGENGLHLALKEQNFELANEQESSGEAENVDFVVVGMTRHVCYDDFAIASNFINRGAVFIGTNPDVTFPTEDGSSPGAGSLLAFLEAATGEKPIVIGKPNAGIFKEALVRLNALPKGTFMVGDRLNTDITGAQRQGIGTILLLSGVTSEAHLVDSGIRPDFVFTDLQELTRSLQSLVEQPI